LKGKGGGDQRIRKSWTGLKFCDQRISGKKKETQSEEIEIDAPWRSTWEETFKGKTMPREIIALKYSTTNGNIANAQKKTNAMGGKIHLNFFREMMGRQKRAEEI